MPPHEGSLALSSTEALILQNTLVHLTAETKRNADAVFSIHESLRTLTRLEATHGAQIAEVARISRQVELVDDRILEIERDMPGLRELRKWVVLGIVSGVGMMGIALTKLVLIQS